MIRARSVAAFSLGIMTGLLFGTGLTLLLSPNLAGPGHRDLGTRSSSRGNVRGPASGNNKPASKPGGTARKRTVRAKAPRKTTEGEGA